MNVLIILFICCNHVFTQTTRNVSRDYENDYFNSNEVEISQSVGSKESTATATDLNTQTVSSTEDTTNDVERDTTHAFDDGKGSVRTERSSETIPEDEPYMFEHDSGMEYRKRSVVYNLDDPTVQSKKKRHVENTDQGHLNEDTSDYKTDGSGENTRVKRHDHRVDNVAERHTVDQTDPNHSDVQRTEDDSGNVLEGPNAPHHATKKLLRAKRHEKNDEHDEVENNESHDETHAGLESEEYRKDPSEELMEMENSGDYDSLEKKSVNNMNHGVLEENPGEENNSEESLDEKVVRVKRVSRAGSSHRRRPHKNQSNSRVGQNQNPETIPKPTEQEEVFE